MSKENDFLLPFPTRHGEPSGHANERQMADKVDRSSIRTVIRNMGDGSEVMLRTRAGFNEYTTTKPEGKESVGELYLESGAQTALDESDNPSVWNLCNLNPPSDYLGWIYADGPLFGKHAHGLLNSGNASKAMVEPARKPVAKGIPASLFSGSMRLFIQALYGAKNREELSIEDEVKFSYGSILTINDYSMGAYSDHIRSCFKNDSDKPDASNRVLYYIDKDNHNTTVRLGFSTNESCGLFRSGKKYWVITLSRSGYSYAVKAYPLKFPVKTAYMRSRVDTLRKPEAQTDASREAARKCMAYALAYAKLDTANVVDLGVVSSPDGYALAYGWKWNFDGTEARIITHKTTIGFEASYWTAYEGKLTIAYTDNPYITEEADKFSVEVEITQLAYWKDHVSSLIYRPLSETVDPEADHPYRLHQTTIVVPYFAAAIGECKDLPIYGFYVGEDWVPLLYSNFTEDEYGSFVYYDTANMHGAINLGAGSDMTSHPLGSGILELDYMDPFIGYTVGISHVTSGSPQAAYYKMVPRQGINTAFKFGDAKVVTSVPNAVSKRTDMAASFSPDGDSIDIPFAELTGVYPNPSEFVPPAQDFLDACLAEQGENPHLTDYWVTGRTTTGSFSGEWVNAERPANKGDPIALVIPHGDSEAFFLLSGDDKNAWTTTYSGTSDPFGGYGYVGIVGIRRYVGEEVPPVYTNVEEELVAPVPYPITEAIQLFNPTLYAGSDPLTGEDTENTFVNGKVTPAKTSGDIEYADFWEPESLIYEAGMYALSGTGIKFITSEGLYSDNIAYEDRFCGWV